ncbi:DUF998 domain-containing protein [Granulicoccus phenolivorans]|uniref:DUF998 domain-containing protein n=1 Tax=Granulicoccus phenolivorans TaxID=266854 RepID=UPI00041D8486|nr:DUF998 domain-containing protein [Granulicoccus phenolivorans]
MSTQQLRRPRSDVTSNPIPPGAHTWAGASAIAAMAALALIVGVILADRQIDPSWRFISEYQLGVWGGFMSLAFLALSVSACFLVAALHSQVATPSGRVGLGVLTVSAAGFLLAGAFRTDPVDASVGSLSGFVHSIAAMLGGLVPLAAFLIAWSLARNIAWRPYRRSLRWITTVAILANIASITQQIIMGIGGGFGPGVPLGWPNRAFVLLLGGWLLAAALLVRTASRKVTHG